MFDICPTVTPNARMCVVREQRFVTAAEKHLLNMVPMHLLDWPAELSENDIADMPGNAMRLKAAGFAMVIASAFFGYPDGD